jgi:hypothetical protein
VTECSAWVDPPSDPDPVKFANNGISIAYFDGRWLAAKADPLAYMTLWRKKLNGSSIGIYFCDPWQWPGISMDPVKWADWLYVTVQMSIAPGTFGDFPRVDLNYEQDDPAWILAALRQWRKHSPRRTTAFVTQSHKASVYTTIAHALTELNITVKPECFVGSQMERVESAAEVLAWQMIGVKRVEPMLDGSQMAAWWNQAPATAFTQGRLPA